MLESTLATVAADVEAQGLQAPAVVVVGEVVRLRQALDWHGALAGKVLTKDPLGTRSKGEAV